MRVILLPTPPVLLNCYICQKIKNETAALILTLENMIPKTSRNFYLHFTPARVQKGMLTADFIPSPRKISKILGTIGLKFKGLVQSLYLTKFKYKMFEHNIRYIIAV